ncbi:hypothetical protein [Xenorhabdus bovienii]|uniref:hypothetical protein n=1 Tax=Xenorhabdus bovienii TaxID=40576 RepID=UPI003DA6491F
MADVIVTGMLTDNSTTQNQSFFQDKTIALAEEQRVKDFFQHAVIDHAFDIITVNNRLQLTGREAGGLAQADSFVELKRKQGQWVALEGEGSRCMTGSARSTDSITIAINIDRR